uniref:Glycosyltransferase family 92 protein n=1 Tax=Poecilia formosa TaxID=48698 RepID=A0A087XJ73_POEFO
MTQVLDLLLLRRLLPSLTFIILCLMLLLLIFRSDRMLPPQKYMMQLSDEPAWVQNQTTGTTVLKGQSAHLIRVKGSKTLLVSAFLEHRTKPRKVLVIAIMFRKEKVSLQCSLRCREQLHVSRASVDIHWDHFGFPYGTADVSCPLPPACQAPTHVAVTSAAIRNPDEADLEFLEVQNQKALTVFPYNFTSCFSTMYNYTNILQLVQTVEMLQLLGVNRIVIYKTNCSNETQRVLDYYTDKGLVEVVPWSLSKYLKVSRRAKPDQDPGDIHYFGQIPALNDCLYRFMYRSKYVALHDPDELILPQTVDSWSQLLPLLEKRHGADRCFNFENNWFPTEFTERPPPPNVLPALGHWHNVFGVNILTHLYREPVKPKPVFNNYKIIANPRSVFVVTVHGVLRSQENCAWVDRKTAHMYHTKARGQNGLKAQQLVYDGRLLSYSGRLTAAVNAVLNETRLLPE